MTRFTIAAGLIFAMATCPFAQERTVTVRITAERFRFTPDEIKIHRGDTVEFVLESDDTDHGFRIVGTDGVRGIPTRGRASLTVTFPPHNARRHALQPSNLCGAGHDFMHGVLVVED